MYPVSNSLTFEGLCKGKGGFLGGEGGLLVQMRLVRTNVGFELVAEGSGGLRWRAMKKEKE